MQKTLGYLAGSSRKPSETNNRNDANACGAKRLKMGYHLARPGRVKRYAHRLRVNAETTERPPLRVAQ